MTSTDADASYNKNAVGVYKYRSNEYCNGCGKVRTVRICKNNHKICMMPCATNPQICVNPPDEYSCIYCGFRETLSSPVNHDLLTEAIEDEEVNKPAIEDEEVNKPAIEDEEVNKPAIKDEEVIQPEVEPFFYVEDTPSMRRERNIESGKVTYKTHNSALTLPFSEADVEIATEKMNGKILGMNTPGNASSPCLDPPPVPKEKCTSSTVSDEMKDFAPLKPIPDDSDFDINTVAEDIESYIFSGANEPAIAGSTCLDSPLVLDKEHAQIENFHQITNQMQNLPLSAQHIKTDTVFNSEITDIIPVNARSQILEPNEIVNGSSVCLVPPIMLDQALKKNTTLDEMNNNPPASFPIQANSSSDSETLFGVPLAKEHQPKLPRGFQTDPFETACGNFSNGEDEYLPYIRFEQDETSDGGLSFERKQYFDEMRRKINSVKHSASSILPINTAVRCSVLEDISNGVVSNVQRVGGEHLPDRVAKIKNIYYPLLECIWKCEQHHKLELEMNSATHGAIPFLSETYNDVMKIGEQTLRELKNNLARISDVDLTAVAGSPSA